MCTRKGQQGGMLRRMTAASQFVAPAETGGQASKQGTIEASLRRKRAGVAADILTSPAGIPAVPKLGQVS